jgi:hypothetical protein
MPRRDNGSCDLVVGSLMAGNLRALYCQSVDGIALSRRLRPNS